MVQSALGLLALLDESEPSLQAYALEQINPIIGTFWAEVADDVVKIEQLSENPAFPARQLASLIASKVYYHLGNLDEALSFALGAGKLFDVGQSFVGASSASETEYVETIISKAIDTYVDAKSSAVDVADATPAHPDARLEAIVERMFDRCLRDGEYKQAMGISLSAHRLDVIKRVFESTKDASLLEWVLQLVVREGVIGGSGRQYKSQVLELLIKLFGSLDKIDYFSITQCFVYLNDPSLASNLISDLLKLNSTSSEPEVEPSEEDVLIAYQIAFDLADTATQEFLQVVRTSVEGPNSGTSGNGNGGGSPSSTAAASGSVVGAVDSTNGASAADIASNGARQLSSADLLRERLQSILSGEDSIKLYLEFLYRNNHADMLILKGTKDALESRNSIYHSAVTFMNAFANAGTTSDLFLRENLDWLSRASNWSKFSATAALGVIHKGNLSQGKAILEPYLPQTQGAGGGGAGSSFYSEGGSLYALGLVHANHGNEETLGYLKDALKSGTQNEIIQHGAALGLGVAAMGSGNDDMYEELRNVLFNDSAIAGEAAGYAMGLVMLGTASDKALDEMLQYAHETQHEKIIRGLAIGISFLMYGKEEEADSLIETLLGDADAILRYGGIHTIAMAYAGTGNNKAIRKLLHVAVSDVSDDVRRAAVTSLGFILFRNPSQVPRIVQLLSESYNPNVRYGAALALGISCAGTGLEDAIELLEPLTKDPVDFVRQGACISLAMILIQQNDTINPKVSSTRMIFEKIIGDKHEDAMAKFGAALSQGIIDAGGRNVTISMQNKSGSSNMPAIVGMALFTQFWYWFPLAHLLSLSFTPTAIIGVNKDLQIPKFDFVSNARPSLFVYPPATKPPTKEAVAKVATAVLSTTAKATARAKAKEQEKGDEMETDDKDASVKAVKEDAEMKPATEDGTTSAETKEEKPTPIKAKRKPEPTSDRLSNLSRVTPAQLSYISFPADGRYVPVRSIVSSSSKTTSAVATPGNATPSATGRHEGKLAKLPLTIITPSIGAGGGILMMKDQQPEKEAEFLEMEVTKVLDTAVAGAAAGIVARMAGVENSASDSQDPNSGPIAEPPAPFEWTDWD